jgi:hypothetical protein
MDRKFALAQWDTGGLAFLGALFGVMLVIAHEIHDISLGALHAVDPFAHIMSEFAGAAVGGALLFAAAALIRNWIMRQGCP